MPFKWYPKEEILPHAAAWRLLDLSESNGRPIDLVIATKFPTYFVAASEQGRLADPPVPRRVRAVRHAVQRFQPHRARRRPARHADAARHRDARRVPRACSRTPATRRRGCRNSTASGPSRCIIRRGWRRGSQPGPYGDYVLSVGRIESVKRVDLIVGAMARGRSGRCGWSSPATARSARNVERAGRALRRRRSRSTFLGTVERRRAHRALRRRAGGGLSAVRRGLRLRHARGVPRRASRSSRAPIPAGRTSSSWTA